MIIVTKSGQKVSAWSKILALHSTLVAALLENLKLCEKATISVDSTTEEVSTLLSLLNTGESSLETGCMLGEVCRLAKSLGIQLHGVTVLNSSLSYEYDASYLLQENEDETDVIQYLNAKELRDESATILKPNPVGQSQNDLTFLSYKYETRMQETKDEPDIFEYIEVKKHEDNIVAPIKYKSRILNVDFQHFNSYEFDTSYLLQETEEEPDIIEYIEEKEHENEIVAPTKLKSVIQKVKALNSPSYEYNASYIFQEPEEEPDVIEFIEKEHIENENVGPTEPWNFVKSFTLPMNFIRKVRDRKQSFKLDQKKTHVEQNNELETKACFFCPKSFKSKSKLKFHAMCRLHRSQLQQAAHTGYSCNFCKEVFHFTSFLKSHIKNTHKEVMQYVCIKCSIIFSSPSDIKDHIKCNYSGELSQ